MRDRPVEILDFENAKGRIAHTPRGVSSPSPMVLIFVRQGQENDEGEQSSQNAGEHYSGAVSFGFRESCTAPKIEGYRNQHHRNGDELECGGASVGRPSIERRNQRPPTSEETDAYNCANQCFVFVARMHIRKPMAQRAQTDGAGTEF